MNTKYDLNDFTLIPAEISTIESRTECNPYLENEMLPLFTAPMGAVIDDKNWTVFNNNKIHTVIPRTVPLETRMELCEYTFVSLSLSEFEEFVEHNAMLLVDHYICVDLAQGAMQKLIDLCAKGKEKFGNRLVIMTGNIANPKTYYHYAKAGIDYVRCSVGNGSCCVGAGTKVTMCNGSIKNIEDIDVGECVKTLSGNGTVINTFSKKVNKTIKINESLICTPDHKILVINKKDKDKVTESNVLQYAFYIEAQYLNDSYLLVEDKNV